MTRSNRGPANSESRGTVQGNHKGSRHPCAGRSEALWRTGRLWYTMCPRTAALHNLAVRGISARRSGANFYLHEVATVQAGPGGACNEENIWIACS